MVKVPELLKATKTVKYPPRYRPNAPETELKKLFKYSPPREVRRPLKAAPTEALDPDLETNIFAKLLASRPKMDMHTRIVAPGILWNKIGINNDTLTAIPRTRNVKGPRAYLTPMVKEIEKRHRPITKKKRYDKVKLSLDFQQDLTTVENEVLRSLLEAYEPSGPVILQTKNKPTDDSSSILTIDSTLPVPNHITVGKHYLGVPLAGYIYKQWYLHRSVT